MKNKKIIILTSIITMFLVGTIIISSNNSKNDFEIHTTETDGNGWYNN